MSLKQITLVVAFFSVASVLQTEGIRLCGKRLADILNFICEKHGGFHVPRIRREVSPRFENMQHPGTVMRSLMRRSDSSATTKLAGMEFSHQRGGVVDECCKKTCTLSTLASYCANARDVGDIDLHDILPSGSDITSILPEEAAADMSQMATSNIRPSTPVSHSSRLAHSSRPNLGLTNRDRSVFIVLSQLQEDEDKALGEYRF